MATKKKNTKPARITQTTPLQLKKPAIELHACMGLNACKGHDVFGTNNCAGQGKCATQHHSCHTLNNCRGQGGCGLYGTTKEQCKPGANDCAFQGSCGTPIPASRFITQGPNKGKSVWQLARQLFEKRMDKAGRTVGKSPSPYGPSLEFLKTVGEGSSCGSSGPKYCSFASPEDPKKQERSAAKNHKAFVKDSAKHIKSIVNNCEECEDE